MGWEVLLGALHKSPMYVILQEKQDCAWMEMAVQELPAKPAWSAIALARGEQGPNRGYENNPQSRGDFGTRAREERQP